MEDERMFVMFPGAVNTRQHVINYMCINIRCVLQGSGAGCCLLWHIYVCPPVWIYTFKLCAFVCNHLCGFHDIFMYVCVCVFG